MKTKIYSCLAVLFFLPVLAMAQDKAALTVEDIKICTGVQDRQPAGVDTSFAKDVGQLYCYTKISGDQASAAISHVWYYNDKEVLKVDLNAQAKTWRTWSTKKIQSAWTGKWRVDVLSSDGGVLASAEFTIKE
jgi:hypothetical protein